MAAAPSVVHMWNSSKAVDAACQDAQRQRNAKWVIMPAHLAAGAGVLYNT